MLTQDGGFDLTSADKALSHFALHGREPDHPQPVMTLITTLSSYTTTTAVMGQLSLFDPSARHVSSPPLISTSDTRQRLNIRSSSSFETPSFASSFSACGV